MIYPLPIILLWHDKEIDMRGEWLLEVPVIYIRRGRTLTVKNASSAMPFRLFVSGTLTNDGNLHITREGETTVTSTEVRVHKLNLPRQSWVQRYAFLGVVGFLIARVSDGVGDWRFWALIIGITALHGMHDRQVVIEVKRKLAIDEEYKKITH